MNDENQMSLKTKKFESIRRICCANVTLKIPVLYSMNQGNTKISQSQNLNAIHID